jgi:hypothetical protein
MSFIKDLFGRTSIGFTGTRQGMTQQQRHTVYHLLHEIQPDEVHHGDCTGADAHFHDLVRETTRDIRIIGHPPINDKARAFCIFDETREPKDYIPRDRDIVDESQLLIATPKGFKEELRSGTWTTIRLARKAKKPTKIVWLDGSITEEN